MLICVFNYLNLSSLKINVPYYKSKLSRLSYLTRTIHHYKKFKK